MRIETATGVTRRSMLGAMGAALPATVATGSSGRTPARPTDAQPTRIAFVAWLEGAAMTADGTLFFSDVLGNRIHRLADGSARATVFRDGANYPNGSVIDRDGGLVTCEAGDPAAGLPPRIVRTDPGTGERSVLIDLIDGRRLLGPNDVRLDAEGRLVFTDGHRPPFLPPLDGSALPARYRNARETTGVYRIEVGGRTTCLLGPDTVAEPNGLGFSADGRWLFVNDNDPRPGGARRLLRFALDATGAPGERRVLHDFGRGRPGDGMIVDHDGDVVICAGLNAQMVPAITGDVPAGVHIFTPDGVRRGYIPIPEDNVTNLVEHHRDRGRYLVTAGRSIYRVNKADAVPL